MGKISEWAKAEAEERAQEDKRNDITRTPYGYMRITGGTHPEFVDYSCPNCQRVMEDVLFPSKAAVTDTVTCSCGSEAVKVILRTNFIHPSLSTLYGRPQPALGYSTDPGDQINDYGDKQRVMRKYGLTESNDAEKGNSKRSDGLRHQAYLREKRRGEAREQSIWVGNTGKGIRMKTHNEE